RGPDVLDGVDGDAEPHGDPQTDPPHRHDWLRRWSPVLDGGGVPGEARGDPPRGPGPAARRRDGSGYRDPTEGPARRADPLPQRSLGFGDSDPNEGRSAHPRSDRRPDGNPRRIRIAPA